MAVQQRNQLVTGLELAYQFVAAVLVVRDSTVALLNSYRYTALGFETAEKFLNSGEVVEVFMATPVNTVPGAQSVDEHTALPIAGVSVFDADGGTLTTTLSVLSGALHVTAGAGVSNNDTETGTVTITGTQAEINAALAGLSYIGNLNFNGPVTLTVSTSDGALADTDIIAITVLSVDDEPTANADTASVAANAVVTGNVLDNDTDPDLDPLNVSSVDQGINLVGQAIAGNYGTLILNADGSYTYTANNSAPPGPPVTDTFTYTVTDHHGGSDALFVNFDASDYVLGSINGQNGWTVTGLFDQSVVSDGPGVDQGLHFTRQVTSGSFADQLYSPALTQIAGEASAPGAITSFFEASWTMTPQALETSADAQNGFIGISMDNGTGVRGNLLRLVNDVSGNWVLHALDFKLGAFTDETVAVLPVGVATTIGFTQQFVDGPGNDAWNVYVNEQLVFTGTGWEDFHRPFDPTPVSYDNLLFRASGSAVIGDQGVIIDDVSYTTNQQSTLTVSVQVINAPEVPVAQNGSASGDEDKPIAGTLVATDGDSPTLTYGLVAQAAHGGVVLSPDGSYTYTPAADFNGSDSFTFVANDGVTDSNVATVTLTVNPVGDNPGQGPGGVPVPDPIGFDAGFYLATNPDVAAAGVDPLDHFNTFGWREGRNPSAAFDTDYYLAQNPDVAAAGVNPLEHFNTFGWHEGRDPSAYFDTSGYLEHYADVAAAGVNPLQHYQQFGWFEGRDPSLAFDTTQYLAVYTDVAAAHVDPLGHFLSSGISEGRSAFGDGFWE